jgi:hypothetical protein
VATGFHELCAGLDRGLEVQRPETGRRRQDDQVGARVERLLIGVEADEPSLGRHVDAIFHVPLCRKLLVAAFQAIAENVGHGDQLDFPLRAQGLLGRARPTTSATDERDLDLVVAGGCALQRWQYRLRLRRPERPWTL